MDRISAKRIAPTRRERDRRTAAEKKNALENPNGCGDPKRHPENTPAESSIRGIKAH